MVAGAGVFLIARRWRTVAVPVIAAFVITASASGGYLAWTTLRDSVVHEQIVCATQGSGNVELASGRFTSGEHEKSKLTYERVLRVLSSAALRQTNPLHVTKRSLALNVCRE